MALVPKKTNSLTGVLNLGDMLPEFVDQFARKKERQVQETEKTVRDLAIQERQIRDTAEVNERSRQSAEVTRQQQLKVLGDVNGQLEKANQAMRLADSQNPMDRLSLWMLQQSDPSYTRDGNLRRIEYLQNASNALGGMEVLRQAGYTDQVAAIQENASLAQLDGAGDLALAQLAETQGEERLTAVKNYMADLSGMLTNQQSIIEATLAKTPNDAIDAAVEEAKASENGTASIGGVTVPRATLEARQQALRDRSFLEANRDYQMIGTVLSNMTAEQVAEAEKQASGDESGRYVDPNTGTVLPLARLRERAAALRQADYQDSLVASGIQEVDRNTRRTTDQRIIESMNSSEISSIITNNGRDQNGRAYDLDQLSAVLQTKRTHASEGLSVDVLKGMGMLAEAPAAEYDSYLDTVTTEPGSALDTLKTRHKQFTRIAAARLSDPKADDLVKMDMYQLLQSQREELEAGIKADALRQANDDPDLAVIKEAQIRNTTVSPEVMENMIVERAKKGKSFEGILPPELNRVFMETFMAKKSEYNMSGLGLDSKDIAAMAATDAINAIRNEAVGGLQEEFELEVYKMPGNPVRAAGLSEVRWLSLAAEAEMKATSRFAQENNLNEQQVNDLRAGKLVMDGFHSIISAAKIQALEEYQPGLGEKFAAFYSSPGFGDGVRTFVQKRGSVPMKGTEIASWSLVAPEIPNNAATQAMSIQDGLRVVYQDKLIEQKANFVAFGGNGLDQQAFLIQQTLGLTSAEKKLAIQMIAPIIDEGKTQKLDPLQLQEYVEGRLFTMQAPTPELGKVLQKLKNDRERVLSTWSDIRTVAMVYSNYSAGTAMSQTEAARSKLQDSLKISMDTARDRFKWYDEYKGKK